MKTHFPWFPMFFLQENMISWIGDGFFNRCRATFGGAGWTSFWMTGSAMLRCQSQQISLKFMTHPHLKQRWVWLVFIWVAKIPTFFLSFFHVFFRKIAWVHHVRSSLRLRPQTVWGRWARAGRLRSRGSRLCGEQLPGRFDATGGDDGTGWEDITIRTRMNKASGKRLHKTNWKDPPFFMDRSTIYITMVEYHDFYLRTSNHYPVVN